MKIGLLLGTLLLTSTLSPSTAQAANLPDDGRQSIARSSTASVSIVRAPKQATEGDRVKVTLRVASPKQARNVRIETMTTDLWGSPVWTKVRASKVRRARETLTVTPDQQDVQRYRAVVSYRGGKTASAAFRIRVWRWVPLFSFGYYAKTDGVSTHGLRSEAINGLSYDAWYGYGSQASWESRHTLGRHCRRFSGVLGVLDHSPDGSSAQISLYADDALIFTSEQLSPGMDQRVDVAMPRAYRIAIQALNTAEDDSPWVSPGMGDPRFLCTGV